MPQSKLTVRLNVAGSTDTPLVDVDCRVGKRVRDPDAPAGTTSSGADGEDGAPGHRLALARFIEQAQRSNNGLRTVGVDPVIQVDGVVIGVLAQQKVGSTHVGDLIVRTEIRQAGRAKRIRSDVSTRLRPN